MWGNNKWSLILGTDRRKTSKDEEQVKDDKHDKRIYSNRSQRDNTIYINVKKGQETYYLFKTNFLLTENIHVLMGIAQGEASLKSEANLFCYLGQTKPHFMHILFTKSSVSLIMHLLTQA